MCRRRSARSSAWSSSRCATRRAPPAKVRLPPLRPSTPKLTRRRHEAPPKSYTLRSTLPLDILRALAQPDEKLLPDHAELPDEEPEAADALAMYEFHADDGYARDVKREEGGAYGVLGVILGLILVSGKVLGEGAPSSVHLPFAHH